MPGSGRRSNPRGGPMRPLTNPSNDITRTLVVNHNGSPAAGQAVIQGWNRQTYDDQGLPTGVTAFGQATRLYLVKRIAISAVLRTAGGTRDDTAIGPWRNSGDLGDPASSRPTAPRSRPASAARPSPSSAKAGGRCATRSGGPTTTSTRQPAGLRRPVERQLLLHPGPMTAGPTPQPGPPSPPGRPPCPAAPGCRPPDS